MGPSILHPKRSRLAWAIMLALPLAPALQAGQSFDEFYVEIRGPGDIDASQKASPLESNPQVQQSVPAQPAIRSRSADMAGVYGPVRRGQTLWAVASAVRPAPSVTVQQTMLALYRKNPTAFAPGQLNNIYMGTFLRVPTLAEVQAEDEQTAFLSARRGQPILARAKPQSLTALASTPKPILVQPKPTPAPETASDTPSPAAEVAATEPAVPAELQSSGEIISESISIPAEAKVEQPEPALTVAAISSLSETAAPSGASGSGGESTAEGMVQNNGSVASQVQAPAADELTKLSESNAQLNRQLQQLSGKFAQLQEQLSQVSEPVSQPADPLPSWAAALASPMGLGMLFGLPTLLLLGMGLLWQRLRSLEAAQPQVALPTLLLESPPIRMAPGLFAEPAMPFDVPASRDAAAAEQLGPAAGMSASRAPEPPSAEPLSDFSPEIVPVPAVEPEVIDATIVEPEAGVDTRSEFEAGPASFQVGAGQGDASEVADGGEFGATALQEPTLRGESLDVSDVAEPQTDVGAPSDWQSRAPEPQTPLEFEGFSSLVADLEPTAGDSEHSEIIEPAGATGDAVAQGGRTVVAEEPQSQGFLDIDILLSQAEAATEPSDEPALAIKDRELPSFEGLELEQSEANNFSSEMDLARAYLEIDDQESARELLTQLLAEGSNKQKAEAQKLLKRLK